MQGNESLSTTNLFFSLTPEKILEAVESAGYRCTGRCLALNSLENRVYQVEIEVSESTLSAKRYANYLVAKFYRPQRWSMEQIQEEHAFLTEAFEADIPVVLPLSFSDGETLSVVPNSAIYFALFPRIGGRLEDELDHNKLTTLGRLIARLHIVGASRSSKLRISLNPKTYALEPLNFLLNHQTLPDIFKPKIEQLVKRICQLSESWFKETKIQRLHGDLHIGNLLWDGKSCMIVDFDDMLSGPAIQDIWLITPGRDAYAKEQREKLISAYSEIRSFDHESIRLIEPLRALRMVHFSAWIAKRWEDPTFQRTFLDYGSAKYWNEQISSLMEILEIIESGELRSF